MKVSEFVEAKNKTSFEEALKLIEDTKKDNLKLIVISAMIIPILGKMILPVLIGEEIINAYINIY